MSDENYQPMNLGVQQTENQRLSLLRLLEVMRQSGVWMEVKEFTQGLATLPEGGQTILPSGFMIRFEAKPTYSDTIAKSAGSAMAANWEEKMKKPRSPGLNQETTKGRRRDSGSFRSF